MPVPIVRRNEELKFGGADESSRDAPYINLKIVEQGGIHSITVYSDNVFWEGVQSNDELYAQKRELPFDTAASELPPPVQKVLDVVAERGRQLPDAFSHLVQS